MAVLNVQYFYWFITFLLLAVFVTFTAANLEFVAIDFWPFEYQLSAPFALVVLGCLLTGFVIGAFLMWLRFGAARARAKRAEQRAAILQHELAEMKRSADTSKPARTGGPAPQLRTPSSAYKTATGGN
ncbi:MAG: lipopolysaccharide assembly protein LapA domain-containing protein [Kiloniellaceae bacterium]